MNPNVYFKALICVVLLGLSFVGGYYVEHLRFVAYQERVSAEAKVQEQHNQEVIKQQQLITKQAQNEYQNQLNRIKSYYYGLHYPSSSKLPNTSQTRTFADGVTKDFVSVAQECAIETQKLIDLQQWVADQYQVK